MSSKYCIRANIILLVPKALGGALLLKKIYYKEDKSKSVSIYNKSYLLKDSAAFCYSVAPSLLWGGGGGRDAE
jgi:hypothetical protein